MRAGSISIAMAWDGTLVFHQAGQKGRLVDGSKIGWDHSEAEPAEEEFGGVDDANDLSRN